MNISNDGKETKLMGESDSYRRNDGEAITPLKKSYGGGWGGARKTNQTNGRRDSRIGLTGERGLMGGDGG